MSLKPGDRLGSYTLVRELGHGISASTWLARPANKANVGSASNANAGPANNANAGSADGQAAALKILSLSEASSWSVVDLFHREAAVLAQLRHPGIPRHLESFEATLPDGAGGLSLVIAMEYVEGETLEAHQSAMGRLDEARIEEIMAGLCDILDYLGGLRPPVIHRDVTPRNVILRPDGRVALVDFSGVQDAVRNSLHPGATLVGTAGYVPLEQVAGRATPRSDLYGAAATALFLLTGRNPAELPMDGLKIDYAAIVRPSARLAALLDSWLEPDERLRTLTVSDTAAILRGEKALPASRPERQARKSPPEKASGGHLDARDDRTAELPSDSRITIEENAENLRIAIPPAGFRNAQTGATAGFALVWIGFIAFWTMMTFRMRAPMFFSMFSLPFWAVGFFMVKQLILPAFSSTEIEVDKDRLFLRTRLFGSVQGRSWPRGDMGRVEVSDSPVSVQGRVSRELTMEAGTKILHLGAGLSEQELRHLARRISDRLH